MTIEEFRAKYGIHGFSLVVGEFIRRAPSFDGDDGLAEQIGTMMGDLELALQHLPPSDEGDKDRCECGHVTWAHWPNGRCAHCDCIQVRT